MSHAESYAGLIAALAVAALTAGAAAGAEPDPTVLTPASPAAVPAAGAEGAAPPCDEDPRCRLVRFRAARIRARRAEYLRRVAEAGQELDARIDQATPWREQYRIGADLLVSSSSEGAAIWFAPTWWLRGQARLASFTTSGSSTVSGSRWGAQVRFIPVSFPFAPYGGVGFGWLRGSVTDYGSLGQASTADAAAQLLTLALGVELVVPYFHVGLGYEYERSVYEQATKAGQHQDHLRQVLEGNLADHRHQVVFEIGTVF